MLFMMLCILTVAICILVLVYKRQTIEEKPDKLVHFSAIYAEYKTVSSPALFAIVVYFVRRILVCICLVAFYQISDIQIIALVYTSVMVSFTINLCRA